ncbi:MAG TPA: methyltransferase domain-containing protein [Acidimicrobiia bacterium]|nr:methyltransferase domain-containing protein [Acidimicrobiia bacterium]
MTETQPSPNPSPRYTHGHHEAVLRSHRWRTVENSAAYLLPHLGAGTTVLDIGCGPGTITLDIAARVAPAPVIGIDVAPAAIEAATAERERRGTANADFRTADLYALDVEDDTFDIVHAHQVLQHLSDPVGALREMRRVCKPGGLVAARDSDYAAMTWYPAVPAMSAWLRMYDAVARANDGEPNAGRFLLSWAHAAGFTDVQPGASAWCYATPEEREWWGELWADRITQSAIAAQAVEIGAATEAELRAMAEAWRSWSTEPDGWFAVLHGEILCRS